MAERELVILMGELELLAAEMQAKDLPSLVRPLSTLQEISSLKNMPKALCTQCQRLVSLLESAVMGDVESKVAITRARQGIAKLARAVQEHNLMQPAGGVAETQETQETQETITQMDSSRAEDMDLVRRFVANQQIQLEDLEVFILELEKGHPQALGNIKRYLHTLKGEFGVLDFPQYAGLIHECEEYIQTGALQGEHLLRLKDFLAGQMAILGRGGLVPKNISAVLVLGLQDNSATAKPPAEEIISSESLLIGEHEPEVQTPPNKPDRLATDPSFLLDFVQESADHIHNMETALLRLETDGNDGENINQVFRACHTIKGLAGFLELHQIKHFAHAFENLMDRARQGKIKLGPEHAEVLLVSTDCLRELIKAVEFSLNSQDYPEPARLKEMLQLLEHPEHISVQVRAAAPGKKVGEILLEEGQVSSEELQKALAMQKAGDQRRVGEILMEEAGVLARDVGRALGSQMQAKKAQVVEDSVRVPVSRLDALIDAIGEAVIAQSMLSADSVIADLSVEATADDRIFLRRKVNRADMIMRQIQELSMSLRMVSIRGVFQKMTRLVRDLSKKMEKEIDLVLEGESTELDKSVVENIGDPLIHLVRNSIDHGIETAEQRKACGKAAKATITLRAYHKAGNVHIDIEDDGRGLDREAILRKAREKGLWDGETRLSDQEVNQMIFRPGFSTAKQVTDVSGRGVGMDVVKRNIEALRGSVEIHSEAGKGTLITLRLPLTLAIINGMVLRVGNERYIIPTLSVLETLRPEADDVESIIGKGEIIRLRKDLIRVVRLHKTVHDKAGPPLPQCVVLVVEDAAGGRVGLAADEILDQQQVVIKKIGEGIGQIPGISGGAIMNNGEVCLILDVAGVVRIAGEMVL